MRPEKSLINNNNIKTNKEEDKYSVFVYIATCVPTKNAVENVFELSNRPGDTHAGLVNQCQAMRSHGVDWSTHRDALVVHRHLRWLCHRRVSTVRCPLGRDLDTDTLPGISKYPYPMAYPMIYPMAYPNN